MFLTVCILHHLKLSGESLYPIIIIHLLLHLCISIVFESDVIWGTLYNYFNRPFLISRSKSSSVLTTSITKVLMRYWMYFSLLTLIVYFYITVIRWLWQKFPGSFWYSSLAKMADGVPNIVRCCWMCFNSIYFTELQLSHMWTPYACYIVFFNLWFFYEDKFM